MGPVLGLGSCISVPPQGQSEQTYSTVKTGAPAVTVTNLKPATRYVFQIRAASPGPSWETQSFNPSIEVLTPHEAFFLFILVHLVSCLGSAGQNGIFSFARHLCLTQK